MEPSLYLLYPRLYLCTRADVTPDDRLLCTGHAQVNMWNESRSQLEADYAKLHEILEGGLFEVE